MVVRSTTTVEKKEVIYLESKYIKLVSKMCDDRKISKISTRSRIASGYANACGSSPIISWVRSPSNEPPCLSNLLPMSTLNLLGSRRRMYFENHKMPAPYSFKKVHDKQII